MKLYADGLMNSDLRRLAHLLYFAAVRELRRHSAVDIGFREIPPETYAVEDSL